MDEEVKHEDNCPECAKRKEDLKKSDQAGIEILVALMPLLTITFLSNFGLF
ncbi:MAG TPA: hypothetical protein VF390_00600 [Patescibacteria group bacterium]